MSKHTPGPWKVRNTSHHEYSGKFVHIPGEDRLFLYGKTGDVNAHLIVAAPELLAACLAAKAIIGEPGNYVTAEEWNEVQNLLQVAIEKATKEE